MALTYEDGVLGTEVGSGTSCNAQWPLNTVTGHVAVAIVNWKTDVTVTSLQDAQSNSWVDCGMGRFARPVDGYAQIFVCTNMTGGTTPTVTANFSGTATEANLYLLRYSPNGSVDTGIYGSGSATLGTTVVTNNMTPSITSGVVVTFVFGNPATTTPITVSDGVSYTPRLSYGTPDPGVGGRALDRIFTSSVGTIAATGTFGNTITKGGIVAAVIKEASGPAPGSIASTVTL